VFAARRAHSQLVVLSLLCAVAAPEAGATPKPITGVLSKAGYTVIGVDAAGGTTSARATPAFSLTPTSSRVSLHLRDDAGRYAGPVVLRALKKGTRAVLGVKAGAKLGTVTVRAGYATVKAKPGRKGGVAAWTAKARKGVPIGAGRFGRVRSAPPAKPPAGDRDWDGLPAALDVDDDGDLVLDNLDTSPGARAAQAAPPFGLASVMPFEIFQTRNANAGTLTLAQIDEALSRWGYVMVPILAGDSAELDCGGLPWCSPGGTARAPGCGSPSEGEDIPCPHFPECCDADGDGFGTPSPAPGPGPGPGPGQVMFLFHGATTAQIKTGDVLIERVTTAGTEQELAATLQFVFATAPALVTYADGMGNSATPQYPLTSASTGARRHGFPAAAGPSGDVVVTMTFWRPQRTPIPPETAPWIDMGGLNYGVSIEDSGACPASTTTESDPNLEPRPLTPGIDGGYTDRATDLPANPANTFTFSLNLTQCLAAHGQTFNPGEERTIRIDASAAGGDSANAVLSFKRQ
jgi:hypothetical protein